MNMKLTALCSLLLMILLGQSHALSQVQWAAPYPSAGQQAYGGAYGYDALDAMPMGAPMMGDPGMAGPGMPGMGMAAPGMPPGMGGPARMGHMGSQPHLMQASFCGGCGAPSPDQCGCDDSGGGGLCSGACGGSCGGGCGRKGLFGGGLLGGGLLGGRGGGGMGLSGGWMDLEYLLWWSKDRYLPTLVTTAPEGTPFDQAGVFGQAGTQSLFVDDNIGEGPHSGFRISTGGWLDQQQSFGLGGRFFIVAGEEKFNANSDQHSILAVPAFEVAAGIEDAYVIAFPGESTGSARLKSSVHAIGADLFIRKLMLAGNCNRLDFIGGYHTSTVEDEVKLSSRFISQNPLGRIPVGGTVDITDEFEVTNSFHGGFVGLMGQAEDGRLSWRLLAKVALGNMNQEASIRGNAVASAAGATSTTDYGVLTLPSNIGKFDRDEFAVVPELNVSCAYNVSQNASILVGYNFIYWSKVALAGDLIDQTVNQTQIAGPLVGEARPLAQLTDDSFWYSGLSIGASLRF